MNKYECECLYCGYRWYRNYDPTDYKPSCEKCGDKHIKVREVNDKERDVFGYEIK